MPSSTKKIENIFRLTVYGRFLGILFDIWLFFTSKLLGTGRVFTYPDELELKRLLKRYINYKRIYKCIQD